MLSSMQLVSLLSIMLVVIALHSTHAVSINTDLFDESNPSIDEDNKMDNHEDMLMQRRMPVEGILLGRRAFPGEGILLGKRAYPTEGILLGKRAYPTEGILLGKRRYPSEGILLGKRSYPTEGILLGKRNFRFFAPKSTATNGFEK